MGLSIEAIDFRFDNNATPSNDPIDIYYSPNQDVVDIVQLDGLQRFILDYPHGNDIVTLDYINGLYINSNYTGDCARFTAGESYSVYCAKAGIGYPFINSLKMDFTISDIITENAQGKRCIPMIGISTIESTQDYEDCHFWINNSSSYSLISSTTDNDNDRLFWNIYMQEENLICDSEHSDSSYNGSYIKYAPFLILQVYIKV